MGLFDFVGDFFDEITGAAGVKKANKANQKLLDRILELLEQEGIRGEKQYREEILPGIVEGYDKALTDVGRFGAGATQRVLDRGQQRSADLSQGLISRGLGNTTVAPNLERGIAADTDRALLDIDDAIASLRTGLQVGKTQAIAGGQTDLARLLERLALGQVGALGGVQNVPAPGLLQGLGGAPGIAGLFTGSG